MMKKMEMMKAEADPEKNGDDEKRDDERNG